MNGYNIPNEQTIKKNKRIPHQKKPNTYPQHRHHKEENQNQNQSRRVNETNVNTRDENTRDFLYARICAHDRESNLIDGFSVQINCIARQSGDEEAACWTELSSLVKTRRAVGFPLLRGSNPYYSGRMLYFEQFKNTRVRRMTCDSCHEYNLFQAIVILYSMYKRGIFSENIEFDLVSIPRTTFIFSVNQLIFQFSTDTLVVLSLSSRLYRTELPQSCYLNYIRYYNSMSRKTFEASEYFFEWMIRNHLNILSKQPIDVFKLKKKYVPGSHVSRSVEPGTLVYVPSDDNYIAGITLTEVSVSDNVRVIYSIDGSIMEIGDFNIYDVFPVGDHLLLRSQSSFISV